MKKWKFLIGLLLVLLLTGCGGKKTVELCLAEDSLWAELEKPLRQAGYSVTVRNAGLDQAVQNRQIENLLEEAPDLVILEPVMTAQAEELAQLCRQQKVPVLFLGQAPGETDTAWVGLSAREAGAVQGQLAAQLPGADLNGDGVISYAIIAGPETDVDALTMTESCQSAMDGYCLAVSYGEWTQQTGKTACGKLLSTWGKDLEVVLCNSEALALGAMDAIKDGGRTVGKDIFLVSCGQRQMGKLLVKSGDFSGTVVPDMDAYQGLILDGVKALLSGGNVEKQQYGNYIPITKENVEDYLD